jgi:predicted nucleic acid-binding protein
MVWIELLQGVQNSKAQRRALKTLREFERVDLTASDVDWAIRQLIDFRLSHHIGGLDSLIASVSNSLQLPLYTTNVKHFTPMLGGLAKKPY